MLPEAGYLAEIKATTRPILRQHCLQRASNDLPPAALTRLYLQLPAIGGRALCKMAPEYRYMTAPARQRAAKGSQLQKQPNIGGHAYYKMPDTLRAKKTLYIVFSGQDGEFFIPFSVLLSLLPRGEKDVVAVCSSIDRFFNGNVVGLGRSTYEAANTLRDVFNTASYNRVVVMGLSAGGLFAQRVAELLAADIAVSFAGVYGDEGFRLKKALAAGATGFDPLCACRPTRVGRQINVVASKNEFDVVCSKRLKALRPAMLMFHLVHNTEHNVVKPMLKAGYAGVFMRAAIARNGAAIRVMSFVSSTYGLWVVRELRRLFGVQKVASWYVAHNKTVKPKSD